MKTTDFVNKPKKIVESTIEQIVEVPPVELSFPEVTVESFYKKYEDLLAEDAGGMGAGSVATVATGLGENPKQMNKRLQSYTNVKTKGGPVKIKKSK
jgi:hypothetical protein